MLANVYFLLVVFQWLSCAEAWTLRKKDIFAQAVDWGLMSQKIFFSQWDETKEMFVWSRRQYVRRRSGGNCINDWLNPSVKHVGSARYWFGVAFWEVFFFFFFSCYLVYFYAALSWKTQTKNCMQRFNFFFKIYFSKNYFINKNKLISN